MVMYTERREMSFLKKCYLGWESNHGPLAPYLVESATDETLILEKN